MYPFLSKLIVLWANIFNYVCKNKVGMLIQAVLKKNKWIIFKTVAKTLHISKYEAVLLTEVHLEAYQIIQLSAKLNINYKLAVNKRSGSEKKIFLI